ALRAELFVEAALHGGEVAVGHERFDGVDAAAVDCGGERQARQPRRIVDQHGAGAALAAVAARFRSGQSDVFPQIIQQQNVVGNRVGAGAAVERELQNARHGVLRWLFYVPRFNSKNAGPFKGILIRRFSTDRVAALIAWLPIVRGDELVKDRRPPKAAALRAVLDKLITT